MSLILACSQYYSTQQKEALLAIVLSLEKTQGTWSWDWKVWRRTETGFGSPALGKAQEKDLVYGDLYVAPEPIGAAGAGHSHCLPLCPVPALIIHGPEPLSSRKSRDIFISVSGFLFFLPGPRCLSHDCQPSMDLSLSSTEGH